VILFLGAVLSPECKAIVTEFMKGGSLYDLLHNPYQKQKHLPTNYQKLLTAIEIAQGMSYLHGIPILHRDLSCRNILVSTSDTARPNLTRLSDGREIPCKGR
jgi:serine/threonine protein kinase